MKKIMSALLFSLFCVQPALAGPGMGALNGFANSLSDIARQNQDYADQNSLMLQRYKLEMELIDRQHELDIQALDREISARKARDTADLARSKLAEEDRQREVAINIARLDIAHPGWPDLVKGKPFREWLSVQSADISALDGVVLLNVYKRESKLAKRKR